jgi:hypothetical protein
MHAFEFQAAETNARSPARDDDARWATFQAAISVLRQRIHGNGASDLVVAELIEDDLRQAQIAIQELASFVDGAVEAMGTADASPADLVDISDTGAALDACEKLESLLPSIRRRLGQVALRLTRR